MPVNKKVKSKKSISTIKKSVKKLINKNSSKKNNLAKKSAKNSIKKVVSKKAVSPKYYVSETPLKYADREIFGAIKKEYKREASGLELIASENRQDADTIRKLAGEANNINQLAHRANAGGFALVAVELVKLKNRIVEIINRLSDDWKNKKGKRI